MVHFYKKYSRTAFDILLIGLTVYLFMLCFSYLFTIAKPIFMGLLIYILIEPFAAFLHRKGMKKTIAATISMLSFILILVGVLAVLGVIFTNEILHLSQSIPKYATIIETHVMQKTNSIKAQVDALPSGVFDNVKGSISKVIEKGSNIASSFLVHLFDFFTSFSKFVLNFVVGLILAYFLSIEIEGWKTKFRTKTPRTFKKAFLFLKTHVVLGLAKYIRAQLILVTCTFLITLVGFLILSVPNAFTISALIGLVDLLPILGVATVFFPWIAYLLITGNTHEAFMLFIVYLVGLIFRQMAEPKITGDSLGVSAFTMLSFMIISLSVFGVAGLIISPILIILIKALVDHGYLKKWIHIPRDEFDLNDESSLPL